MFSKQHFLPIIITPELIIPKVRKLYTRVWRLQQDPDSRQSMPSSHLTQSLPILTPWALNHLPHLLWTLPKKAVINLIQIRVLHSLILTDKKGIECLLHLCVTQCQNKQSDYIKDWLQEKMHIYLEQILEMNTGPGVNRVTGAAGPPICSRCGLGQSVWRCLDCTDKMWFLFSYMI
jgi:hypothetical protein